MKNTNLTKEELVWALANNTISDIKFVLPVENKGNKKILKTYLKQLNKLLEELKNCSKEKKDKICDIILDSYHIVDELFDNAIKDFYYDKLKETNTEIKMYLSNFNYKKVKINKI